MIRMVDIRLTSMCTAGLFVYIAMVSASRMPWVKLDEWPSSSKVMALYDQKIQVLPENIFMDFPNLTVYLNRLVIITTIMLKTF